MANTHYHRHYRADGAPRFAVTDACQNVVVALKQQVTERFPAMGSQVVLFLGAGLLAAGITV